jgi:crotonobetainyl-CoA:carnitine CoA-transferase CaiB-like acyl-CoA transferase
MLIQSGTFQRDGQVIRGPEVDTEQTGYGPGYRIYEGGDGNWFALVLPDPQSWQRLRAEPELAALPETYAPLRRAPHDDLAGQAESILEAAFRTAPARESVARLRRMGLMAEYIEPMDRDTFRRAVLDDPVNRQLGRVVAYPTADWGDFEQIGPLLRFGPSSPGGPPVLGLPGVGEHTVAVLGELGFGVDAIESLLAAKVARQQ